MYVAVQSMSSPSCPHCPRLSLSSVPRCARVLLSSCPRLLSAIVVAASRRLLRGLVVSVVIVCFCRRRRCIVSLGHPQYRRRRLPSPHCWRIAGASRAGTVPRVVPVSANHCWRWRFHSPDQAWRHPCFPICEPYLSSFFIVP